MRTVFFDCVYEDAPAISIYVDDEFVGASCVVEDLAEIIAENEISLIADNAYCTSSVDFCEEYGFNVGEARKIIVEALNLAVPMMCEVA